MQNMGGMFSNDSRSFNSLTSELVSIGSRREALKNILFKLFLDICSQIHDHVSLSDIIFCQSSSYCVIIGLLLPSIAELANPSKQQNLIRRAIFLRYESDSDIKENISGSYGKTSFLDVPRSEAMWFRQLWFYLVLFQFVSNESTVDESLNAMWTECIRRIASVSPVLIGIYLVFYFNYEQLSAKNLRRFLIYQILFL